MIGLYVHIPFCHAKCHYCDFASFANQDPLIDSYLSALENECQLRGGHSVKTLFIGGGTPTVLSASQINRLFSALRQSFQFSGLNEATVEANPESSSDDVLGRYLSHGINRVSFGLQTTHPSLLKALGRLHTLSDFLSAYRRARDMGYSNINIDLMFGLPGQTREEWKQTLETVLDLAPEHVSMYALKVETGTRFSRDSVETDNDLEADLYLMGSEIMKQAGYNHYEISNFAKPGFESQHNLRYWKNEDFIGIGVSSASLIDHRRTKNTSKLEAYIQSMNGGMQPLSEDVTLPDGDQIREEIMLALRLKEGVEAEIIDKLSLPVFKQFMERELAFIQEGRYRLTPQGWLLSNQMFQYLV